MREVKICRRCGGQITAADRFCGECGLEILAAPEKPPAEVQPPAVPYHLPLGRSTGNKHAAIILTVVLALVFLGGGGLWWWLSGAETPVRGNPLPTAKEKAGQVVASPSPGVKPPDLTLAETYLSEPGLKCTFFVNYANGMSGIVERFTARVSPGRTIRVSEVETGVERGEPFGHVFHYPQWADGIYYVMDQTPEEIVPVLPNGLTVGKTWSYRSEFGQIIWTVLDMGVTLDLGFTTFDNCLVVREDNQPAEIQSIVYYAPGRGRVLVRDPAGNVDYYKMTDLAMIGEAKAREVVMRWGPNYNKILDLRSPRILEEK